MADKKIQWHQAFTAAVCLEFSENRDDLIYEKEYNLNTKPLEIDLLVIKKQPHSKIRNEIGRLFRGHNIMEYKSPEDHLNIDSFYKAVAYACLYKSYGEHVDCRSADDITISIVRDVKPVRLFQYFDEHHITVTNPYPGIYYIPDHALFPTQIIVGNELEKETHKWLKPLTLGLKKQEIREFLEQVVALSKKEEKEFADAILQVVAKANWQVTQELRGDENMCQALLELMEPEISKIVDSAVKSTRNSILSEVAEKNKQTILRAIQSYRDLSFEPAVIKQLLMKTYELSSQEADNYVSLSEARSSVDK